MYIAVSFEPCGSKGKIVSISVMLPTGCNKRAKKTSLPLKQHTVQCNQEGSYLVYKLNKKDCLLVMLVFSFLIHVKQYMCNLLKY